MAKFIVPERAGKCRVVMGGTGLWTIGNGQIRGKNAVFIPCKSRAEADAICEKLNSGDHNGQINIPQNAYHVR